MCSRNVSPPTMYGCNLVTSAMRSFLGHSGSSSFRLRGVHMFLILVQLFLFHSRVLILLEQFLMPMNAKGDGVATHIYDALRWPYGGVSRFVFHSHHASLIVVACHPSETENQREDLHVIVCPSRMRRWAYYPL